VDHAELEHIYKDPKWIAIVDGPQGEAHQKVSRLLPTKQKGLLSELEYAQLDARRIFNRYVYMQGVRDALAFRDLDTISGQICLLGDGIGKVVFLTERPSDNGGLEAKKRPRRTRRD
jgi:hypothetical protein